jgi:hypothetical protein
MVTGENLMLHKEIKAHLVFRGMTLLVWNGRRGIAVGEKVSDDDNALSKSNQTISLGG